MKIVKEKTRRPSAKRIPHKFANGKEYKRCSVCKKYRLLAKFGRDMAMWDKKHYICKECLQILTQLRREAMTEEDIKRKRLISKMSAQRHPETSKRRAERAQKRLQMDRQRLEQHRRKQRLNYRKYKPKIRTRRAIKLNHEIRSGRITRPNTCTECGKNCKPCGHHWSYLKKYALDVIWLCQSCHKFAHNILRELDLQPEFPRKRKKSS